MLQDKEQKTDVRLEGGTSAMQTSPVASPTVPAPDGKPIQLDSIMQKIIVSKNTGEAVDADVLIKGFQRGKMYDKLLSESQRKDNEMKKALEERDTLAKKLNDIEHKSFISNELKAMGITPQSGKDSEEDTSWPTVGEQSPVEIEKAVQKIVAEIRKPTLELMNQLGIQEGKNIEDIVENVFRQKEAERAKQAETNRWFSQVIENEGDGLQEKYGSVLDSTTRKQIQDKLSTAGAALRLAEGYNQVGDSENAAGEYYKYRQLQLSVAEQLAELNQAKKKADTIAEADKILSPARFPGGSPIEDTKPKKFANEIERRKYIESMEKLAAANLDAGQRKRIAMGE